MMWPQLSQYPHLRRYSFLLWSEICRVGGPADWLFEMDLCWREHTAILPLFPRLLGILWQELLLF